ncbi:MAG: hypothetical protein ACK4F0_08315 [Candidatus Ratteibacteria bacterium]
MDERKDYQIEDLIITEKEVEYKNKKLKIKAPTIEDEIVLVKQFFNLFSNQEEPTNPVALLQNPEVIKIISKYSNIKENVIEKSPLALRLLIFNTLLDLMDFDFFCLEVKKWSDFLLKLTEKVSQFATPSPTSSKEELT